MLSFLRTLFGFSQGHPSWYGLSPINFCTDSCSTPFWLQNKVLFVKNRVFVGAYHVVKVARKHYFRRWVPFSKGCRFFWQLLGHPKTFVFVLFLDDLSPCQTWGGGCWGRDMRYALSTVSRFFLHNQQRKKKDLLRHFTLLLLQVLRVVGNFKMTQEIWQVSPLKVPNGKIVKF